MNLYRTADVAKAIGIHPNTVRLYEELELIPKPVRQPNGYRVFTDIHIEQFRLARLAFQIEVLQNGLRKQMINIVKVSAAGDFDSALALTLEYIKKIKQERTNAEEAVILVKQLLSGETEEGACLLKRKEVSCCLGISVDTLRNWEMNGLLTVRRKENGYRIYTNDDLQRLKIIRTLRIANYSLEAILHMLRQLSKDPDIDIQKTLNTPKDDTNIIAVCDKLIISLTVAEENALKITAMLKDMKTKFL